MRRSVIHRGSISLTLMALFTLCTVAKAGEPHKAFTLDPKKDVPLALGSIGTFGLGFHLHRSVEPPNVERLNKENIFILDRFAADLYSKGADQASDITLAVSSSLPIVLQVLAFSSVGRNHREEIITDMVMYAESVLLANGLVMIAKGLTKRPRPYAYNPDVTIEKRRGRDGARSFYSGHTSAAFNAVVFAGYIYSQRHPDSRWQTLIWIGGLSAATATAVLRVTAGQHFPTDVLAAAGMGSLTGFLIPYMHLSRKNPSISLCVGANRIEICFKL